MDEHKDKDIAKISKEIASDHVGSGDCEKAQSVDSLDSDAKVGNSVTKISKESASDPIVDSSATDVQVDSVVMEFSKEIENDRLASGDCADTRNVDCAPSDGSAVTKISKETGKDHVEAPIVDSSMTDFSADSEKIQTFESNVDKTVENGVTQESTVEMSELVNEASDKAMEIETKAVYSSAVIEEPNVETRVVEEDIVMLENHEKDLDSAEKGRIDNMISKPHVAVASMEDEDISNIEGMDSDDFNENFCFSVEELQATFETANRSTENHYDAFADSKSLQELVIEDRPNQSMSCDSCHLEESLDTKTEHDSGEDSLALANAATYELPPDFEGEFEVSDLVWGKVRSHPWWPGQICDPSDASEKAIKYQKKDCFLVAYFGDRTFAWNDASLLKPFRSHFSQVEKQTNSETFHNAVDCALEEFSRRIEFGLACSCIGEDIYNDIKHQTVENAGIRQESSIQNGMEKSLSADLFEPGKLVDYMKALAQCPAWGADRLEIVVAKSQLLAYYRLKGYSELPEFQFCGESLENDDTPQIEEVDMDDKISSGQQNVQTKKRSYNKRKHDLKEDLNPKKKERKTMVDSWDSVADEFGSDGKANSRLLSDLSRKKRKGSDSLADELEGKKTVSKAKGSPISAPKPSFKIGECIRRVASQMSGSPSILKPNIDGSNDGLVADGSNVSAQPQEYSSLDELLLQLQLAARDPLKGYSFSTVIVSFFSDFRNVAIMEQREKVLGEKRQRTTGDETFEFDDMNDTYWTDRVIQNGSEEELPQKSRKRNNKQRSEKPLSKSNSKKRKSEGNESSVVEEKAVEFVDENSPAELVMHFPVVDSVPSETRLIKMFKRFGPLKEIETEIDRDTNRARVVFKKSCDAKAAYSSAAKFNIFGSMLVNYQLNYTVTMPFKTIPVVPHQEEEDAAVFLQF